MTRFSIAAGALALVMAVGCGSPSKQADTNNAKKCSGAKCDTPTDSGDYDGIKQCAAREQDMVKSARKAFTEAGIRWAVADVEGVNAINRDDRGQEYTEYFALVDLPDEAGEELSGKVQAVGHACLNSRFGCDASEGVEYAKELKIELNEDQEIWLEDNELEDVGACVFTSWHSDQPRLNCEETGDCPEIYPGVKVTQELMRMKVGFNSNGAARDLIARCLNVKGDTFTINDDDAPTHEIDGPAVVGGDPNNPEDVLHRDFMRGCNHVDSIFQTGWRRSDSSVCAGAMRLAECGCATEGAKSLKDVVDAVLPTPDQQLEANGQIYIRGFLLGGWDKVDELPDGCQYVRSGDDAQTMVSCRLTAVDLLDNAQDVKELCRKKYANNLTVNVPLPADQISCTPPEDGYNTCSDKPWIITAE